MDCQIKRWNAAAKIFAFNSGRVGERPSMKMSESIQSSHPIKDQTETQRGYKIVVVVKNNNPQTNISRT